MTHPAAVYIDSAIETLGLFLAIPWIDDATKRRIESSQTWAGIEFSLKRAKEALTLEAERNRNMGMDIATIKEESKQLVGWTQNAVVQHRLGEALAGRMKVGRFVQSMLVAFQEPSIVACTKESKFRALHKCASLALLPEFSQVALIQFKNRHCPACGDTCKRGAYTKQGDEICRCRCGREFSPALEVVVMPQWQGYKDIMERHPNVRDVTAVLVHNLDEFELRGDGAPVHKWDPFDEKRVFKSTKDIRGGYLRAAFNDDRPEKYHFISAAEIEKRKQCAKDDSFWNKWPKEMMLKTVYRDAYARRVVPIDPITEVAFAVADQIEENPQQAITGESDSVALLATASASAAIDVDSSPSSAPESESDGATVDDAIVFPQGSDRPLQSPDGVPDPADAPLSMFEQLCLLLDSAGDGGECQTLLGEVEKHKAALSPDEYTKIRGQIDAKARKFAAANGFRQRT